MNTLTDMLGSWRKGNASLDHLFDLAYAQLKQIAAQRLQHADANATLSPTELIHEAVVRVLGTTPQWQNRAHFFASMSLYMRLVTDGYGSVEEFAADLRRHLAHEVVLARPPTAGCVLRKWLRWSWTALATEIANKVEPGISPGGRWADRLHGLGALF